MSEPCPRDWKLCHRGYCAREMRCAEDAACEPAVAPVERLRAERAKAEPVAWQWRRKGEPWSLERTFNSEVRATTADSEVRALYAAPPAPAQPEALCMCKDRPKAECPGEWEPGCDLGANEKFVRVGRATPTPPNAAQPEAVLDALAQIVAILGPTVPPCCCAGCNHEMSEALRIARAALAGRMTESKE